MTKEESLLWYRFLSKYPLRFRRQYVIGNYIVDFYCHKAKLVVELDGSQHYEPTEAQKDRIRTAYLESLGLRVLRFTNLEVLQQFRSVCEAIDFAANTFPRGVDFPVSGENVCEADKRGPKWWHGAAVTEEECGQ